MNVLRHVFNSFVSCRGFFRKNILHWALKENNYRSISDDDGCDFTVIYSFSALSNSNGAFISPLKSCDRRLKLLINEWTEIFYSNWALKLHRKRELRFARQVLSEIYKAKLSKNNVNIEQGQLNFDWFTHHCVVTKRFDWRKEETHILTLKRIRGLLINIHEFQHTLIRVSYAISTQRTYNTLEAHTKREFEEQICGRQCITFI